MEQPLSQNPESQVILVAAEAMPKPLSAVKSSDLARIAQRMIDTDGRLSIRKLHRLYSGRIPGTYAQYNVTVMHLLNRNVLRFSRSNKK